MADDVVGHFPSAVRHTRDAICHLPSAMIWRTRTALIAAMLAVALQVLAPHAQERQPPPEVTFQVEVNYVDIEAIVTDEAGQFIEGLTRDDFEVLEDGRAQKLETFSFVEIPVERRSLRFGVDRPAIVDARNNRQPFSGRVYVILLDDLDISPIRTSLVKRLAREFVQEHVGDNDLAAVVYTSGRTDASQDFTSDRRLLRVAIDKFVGRRMRSLTLDKLDRYYTRLNNAQADEEGNIPQRANFSPGGHAPASSEDIERSQRATGVLDTLRDLSEFLAGIRGRRKAVVMFSEGIDYSLNDVYGAHIATDIVRATQDAIRMAARSNVNFFTIDPRGLTGITAEFIEMQGTGAPELLGTGPGNTTGGTVTGDLLPMNAQADLLRELRLSQDSLRTLADETGGFAAVNSNDFVSAFERIVENNSRYYVLGYYPPPHPRDGRFHRIDVHVKRPGARVSARRGYASPRGATPEERKREEDLRRKRDAKRPAAANLSAELRAVLEMPLQQAGLSFTVHAAPFRSTSKDASVALAIEVDADRLPLVPQQDTGLFANQVELTFFGINEDGRAQRANRFELNLNFRPETYERIRAGGRLRLNPRTMLAPGRYQLRIGIRERATRQTGSVFYDLIVPDFSKEALAMSGLLLTSLTARDVPTAQPDVEAAKMLPGPATSRRSFSHHDTLTVFAEVYDTLPRNRPRHIDTNVTLVSDTGREAFASRESIANGGMEGERWTAHGLTRDIPLKDLAPGTYLLRAEAQLRGEKDVTSATRETVITVLP